LVLHAHRRLASAARRTVVFAVVLSPWLFGSADPWAYLSICLLVSVGVAAWLFSLIAEPTSFVRTPLVAAAALMCLGFVFIQTVHLPAAWTRALSPLAAEAQLAQERVFTEADVAEFLPTSMAGASEKLTISASAGATRRSFYLLLAYVGAFMVLANTITKWRQLRAAAVAIVISSSAMAVLGIIHKFSESKALLWFHVPRFGGAIFGPFTNPNHYAAQMNMAFGVALGLLLAASHRPAVQDDRIMWREKLTQLSTRKASRITLIGFAATLMGASVCVSLSRGGIVSLVASMGVVGMFVALRSSGHGPKRVMAAAALLILATVGWLAWEPVVMELSTLANLNPMGDSRTEASRAALLMFRASPIFGSGFGTFQYVFPHFQGPDIQFGRWLHAHNDYVQLLAEGGILGALLAVLTGIAFVAAVWRRLARATPEGKLMLCGLAVGIATIALHSFIDYGLHKPANAFLLAALCGLSVAAVHIRGNRNSHTTPKAQDNAVKKKPVKRSLVSRRALDGADNPVRHLLIRAGALTALAMLAAVVFGELTELRGELAFVRFYRLRRIAEKAQSPAQLSAAVTHGSAEGNLVMLFSRANADALWLVSGTSLDWAGRHELDPILRLTLAEKAVRAAALSVRAAPSDYLNWVQLARAFTSLGMAQQAELCLEQAQNLAPPGEVVELSHSGL